MFYEIEIRKVGDDFSRILTSQARLSCDRVNEDSTLDLLQIALTHLLREFRKKEEEINNSQTVLPPSGIKQEAFYNF